MKILAIDPGNNESAYVLMDNYKPIEFGKVANYDMLEYISDIDLDTKAVVIEMIASYGMAVGKEVFETCVWIGRFYETARSEKCRYIEYIYRKDVKMNLCGQIKAKDNNISQALRDRFGERKSQKNPNGFFPPVKQNGEKTGWADDVWAAYAVGVTYLDNLKGENK